MDTDPRAGWTADVERANNTALEDWERILDRLDYLLSEPRDRSASGLRNSYLRWSAAVEAAGQAAARLQRGLKLSRARYRDARLAGLPDGPGISLLTRARKASERSDELSREIRRRLASIRMELKSRRPRRPRNSVFAPDTPSHVDIHV